MSRPPAAEIFGVLYLARRIPEFSGITVLISALSAEEHMHFLNQLDMLIEVKYEGGGEVDHGNCIYIYI